MRLLPIVPIVALVDLAGCTAWAYATGNGMLAAAYPGSHVILLVVTVVFGGAAAAAAATFAMDALRARIGRAVRFPAAPVLAFGIGLAAFGLVGFRFQQLESYGGAPYGTGNAVLVVYVAASLLLFTFGFVGYRPSPRPLERWAGAVAAAHGLLGLGFAFLLAYITVMPPNWVT